MIRKNSWGGLKGNFAKTLTPYLYTGRRYSPVTQLYFNRNRYYSPKYGRFISRDPIGFSGGKNLWGYVSNNPVNSRSVGKKDSKEDQFEK
ncbi:MAG: RHS repeat-associated core domain-containing protein [Candidatus Riflebacteria bacterium]|nr:RHS repeat-associated core domain-containing protein [Candidatus Riflebacteria bacterium]